MSGLNDAFKHFGVLLHDKRRSWSGRTADGKTVVVTFWNDIFDYSARPISYNVFGAETRPEWVNSFGNRERIENLIWAKDHCDGLLRVVITEAVDITEYPRRVANAHANDNLIMKITRLDETTGEFSAVNVGTWHALGRAQNP